MLITDIEKSEFIRRNFPANKSSASRRKILYGRAFNDADYIVKPMIIKDRLECPAYVTWRDMIQRCLDPVYKEKHTCYAKASVSEDWLTFMSFRDWWIDHSVAGWQLDKDMISDTKVYGPDTCIYVPQWLNTFSPDRGKTLGVHFDKSRGKFKAYNVENGTMKNIGRYDSFEEAKKAFITERLQYLLARKEDVDAIDIRIYPRLVDMVLSSK